ncbi:MAG: AAA family ATPase [Terriglobales bacterium]
MSERLKRRKKTVDGPAKETSKPPEPLQPRFYDDEPAAPAEASAGESSGPAAEGEAMPETIAASSVAMPAAGELQNEQQGEKRTRPSRRRRGRGGRGGARRRSTAASPAAPAGTSAPALSGVELPSASAPGPDAPAHAGLAPAPPVQVAPTAGAAARASKGTVVLAIGLPGSGKSSWFKRHDIHPLSSDLLRELLFDDALEQRFQDLVFSNLRSMLKARLIARRPMNYVDATNLTAHDRHSWIKLAKDYGYDVQGLFFDVPLEVCMERHQRRGRVVPEDIMRKMAGKLKAPTFEEGFSKITVVRVKPKQQAAE